MCRNFLSDSLPEGLLEALLDQARRAPSAGNTQAVEFLVVANPENYWEVTLTPERRAGFAWPGLLRAPVLVLVLTNPSHYLQRYSEPDKTLAGLGQSLDAWLVPYWWVDAGMVIQNLLLRASAEDLGSCFFGVFEQEETVKAKFNLLGDYRIVGVVALGYPTKSAEKPGSGFDASRLSSSAKRPRRPLKDVVRYHNGY
ncbi:MAG: nitroreductase family protein [Acidimicrobiia bacterium]|nr:nitroreductase family protein [Acidimicrobiia bacterium]MYC56999.1 nitroreductase family protein [Acidimicrobiia bacterium]MYI30864.1 nitroreductase family protein [Acidimicrobiia bacterium]